MYSHVSNAIYRLSVMFEGKQSFCSLQPPFEPGNGIRRLATIDNRLESRLQQLTVLAARMGWHI